MKVDFPLFLLIQSLLFVGTVSYFTRKTSLGFRLCCIVVAGILVVKFGTVSESYLIKMLPTHEFRFVNFRYLLKPIHDEVYLIKSNYLGRVEYAALMEDHNGNTKSIIILTKPPSELELLMKYKLNSIRFYVNEIIQGDDNSPMISSWCVEEKYPSWAYALFTDKALITPSNIETKVYIPKESIMYNPSI